MVQTVFGVEEEIPPPTLGMVFEGNWVVRRLKLEHTGHKVTPGKSKDVSMYRKHELVVNNKHLVKQVILAKNSKVKVSQFYGCFASERNGVDQMTFTQKDLTNVVAEEEKKRLELTEGDANGMIEYFNKMSAENQIFFHLCRFGKDDSLQDVVWVDERSRAAYEEFGDVVYFDSTYLTNKFHLPFAVFLGVNYHGQSIFFGCALTSRETAETYEWVMRTWLHCMGGKALTSILTDQDPAIRNAVHSTMTDTCHRWCIWHILQKFGRYVKHDEYEDVKDDFESLIYGSFDADEFEGRWCDAVDHYKLQDNSWLERIRRCLSKGRGRKNGRLEHITPKHAKKESVTKIRRCYRVVYNTSTYEVACDCKHSECHGTICRHMILVYDLSGVRIVPEKYILHRWRKDVQRKHTRVKVAYHDPLTTDEVRNYHNIMGTYEQICSKASTCKEAV
ncbi:protein FAR1-RELATED SEQUENCE 4-like [Chenopodium quinoa]|uniref:protein FAR1-RELATED SEQUENCE 4-like n=1 Tax=Chenopodium quinoa TaxID=63459 RepID=UPI000B76D02C|nr:protein FAR1-RELATED SEQUENCE 4-like [Chenopodium quinoa]